MGLNFKIEHRNQSIGAGVHLAFIDNIKLLKNRDGSPTLTSQNEGLITITYCDKNGNKIDRTYVIGSERQKMFDKAMKDAGIETGEGASVKSAIGKRIWIAVREEIEDSESGQQIGEKVYYVFKTFPYLEGFIKPSIIGDPEKNDGIPAGDFVLYKQTKKYSEPPFEPTHIYENGQFKKLPDNPNF